MDPNGLCSQTVSDPFVIVHRTFDPIQADLVGDLLRDAGIAARVVGTRSGASIGVGQVIMEVHIAVPRSQAGQATDFLEEFLAADASSAGAGAGADADDEDTPPADRELRPMFAAGSAFLTFGVVARRGVGGLRRAGRARPPDTRRQRARVWRDRSVCYHPRQFPDRACARRALRSGPPRSSV